MQGAFSFSVTEYQTAWAIFVIGIIFNHCSGNDDFFDFKIVNITLDGSVRRMIRQDVRFVFESLFSLS